MKKALPILNLVFYILLVGANFLANYLPLNNVTTGEVSDQFASLFTPTGFTFAIWGLIYLLLGIYAFYQLGFIGSENDIIFYRKRIGFLFILSCIFNIAWLFTWHYQMIFLSLLCIVLLLLTLIMIYKRINSRQNYMRPKNLIFKIPFSIYLGWVMVAVIANVSIYLISIDWNRFGLSEVFWTNSIIIVALLIFIVFLIKEKDLFVMGVFIWAAFGILYKHLDFFNADYTMIIITISFALGSAITSSIFLSQKRY